MHRLFILLIACSIAANAMPPKPGLFDPITYEPLAWAIRKGDVDWLNWLNNFLRQVHGDGRWDAMKKKWFVDYVEEMAKKQ